MFSPAPAIPPEWLGHGAPRGPLARPTSAAVVPLEHPLRGGSQPVTTSALAILPGWHHPGASQDHLGQACSGSAVSQGGSSMEYLGTPSSPHTSSRCSASMAPWSVTGVPGLCSLPSPALLPGWLWYRAPGTFWLMPTSAPAISPG